LLIGGATTSKAHTALKIEPSYSGPVVHVLDASRAVGVTSALLSDDRKAAFAADVRTEYETIRVARAGRGKNERNISIEDARTNRVPIDLTVPVPVPTFTGPRTLANYALDDLVDRIDWTPFFQTWELAGHYPAILQDPLVGETARTLYADARELLARIVRENRLQAHAAFGFWPANAVDETIEVYADQSRETVLERLVMPRQLMDKRGTGRPNFCLADFVAPKASGVLDYLGAFAVTAGHGLESLVAEFDAGHDDYNSILAKALADRLAESFAETLHERVRREFWGYAPHEKIDNADLIKEKYQGIRPAPGYPACPDHTAKGPLFALTQAEARAGIRLTETFAMFPGASVSGWYFWRPESRYFGVGEQRG
jgi:5-methyltetrahydrofolate--homocysteine methyltransferase